MRCDVECELNLDVDVNLAFEVQVERGMALRQITPGTSGTKDKVNAAHLNFVILQMQHYRLHDVAG